MHPNAAATAVRKEKTVDYVVAQLRSYGYSPAVPNFTFDAYVETAPPVLQELSPVAKSYVPGTDVVTMEFSGSAEATGQLVPTNDIVIPPSPTEGSSNRGCEASDSPAAVSGNIALIQWAHHDGRGRIGRPASASDAGGDGA